MNDYMSGELTDSYFDEYIDLENGKKQCVKIFKCVANVFG